MMEVRSRKINRDKLNTLTGGDHETIKFLEQTQTDAASAVGGANDAQSAAEAAQGSADSAQMAADNAQGSADSAATAAGNAQTTANDANTLASSINADYISKTSTSPQSVAGTFQATSYLVAGNQVVGPRITGWTAATGTPNYSAFNGNAAYAAGVVYSQAEAAAMASGLLEARQRIIALEKAMRDHGLIN